MVQGWAQEILRYYFTVIHQSEKMMGGENALTQRFGENFALYIRVAKILRNRDELKCPDSYDDAAFVKKRNNIVKNM